MNRTQLILLFSLILSIPAAYSQVEVPAAAELHLAQNYPAANCPHWEYRDGGLSAMFSEGNQLIKVFYEKQGHWRETRRRLSPNGLPEAVLQHIQNKVGQAFITYAGMVTEQHSRYYRIEAEYSDGINISILSPDGELVDEQWVHFTR